MIIGRNDPCPCGSGKKFKKCCLNTMQGEHEKRMRSIGSVAMPPPGTPEYERLRTLIEKDPPLDKKQMKIQFDAVFNKVLASIYNGANLICDKNLRHFYQEYNSRLFNHGLWSFPTSFNVIEAFMEYRPELNYFRLRDEQDFIFSFDDYLDFYTSDKCIDNLSAALGCFEEKKVYHFNNADDPRKWTIKNILGDEYGFTGISIVRHNDEVSILATFGQLTNTKQLQKEIEEAWLTSTPIEDPAKQGLKPADEYKLEAVNLGGIENLWQMIVLTRFDLSKKTQHVRYILKDIGKGFISATDDPCIFLKDFVEGNDKNKLLENMLEELSKNAVLFEVCKIGVYLPFYIQAKYKDIQIERHPTELDTKLDEHKIATYVEQKDRLFYRDVSVVKPLRANSADIRSLKAPELKMETTGYWKQLSPGQKGVDKNGNMIHGKTWVEKRLSWLESDSEEVFSVVKTPAVGACLEKSGFIYVMRSAAHDIDVFKIGLTRRSTQVRAEELSRSTGSPDKFLVIEQWAVADCSLAEALIHQKLDKYRINPSREFFKVQYDKVRKEIADVIDTINNDAK